MVVYSPQSQAAQINSYPAQGVGQACTTNLEHYNQYAPQSQAAQAQWVGQSCSSLDQYAAAQAQLNNLDQLTNVQAAHFTLPGPNNRPSVVITFDPPSIEVDPGLDWNTAAKCFWNAVYRMSGRAALFPEIG